MPIPADTVLDLWERCLPLDDPGRAVLLASAIAPPHSPADVVRWPLGRRDARLLELREALATTAMQAVTSCPACDEDIEFEVEPATLLATSEQARDPAPVRMDGWEVEWRCPSTADLTAAGAAADVADAEAVLLDRCIVAVSPPPDAEQDVLPTDVRRAVSDAMSASDPLAEILADLVCPVCGAEIAADVDIATFVWTEVAATAERLLADVDVLARAYGWTEPEVLALSDARRRTYLRLARGVAEP